MTYSPAAVARSHVLSDLAADAIRRVRTAEVALRGAARDEDREYLHAVIETAQGYAERLRKSPGFVVEG